MKTCYSIQLLMVKGTYDSSGTLKIGYTNKLDLGYKATTRGTIGLQKTFQISR